MAEAISGNLDHARMGTPVRVFRCSPANRARYSPRMCTDGRQGFTLLEVLIASILLTTGIGALLGTAALTTRMVHRGRQSTRALNAAGSRLEALRDRAAAAPAYCGGLVDGVDTSANGVVQSWRITASGALRQVWIEVSVPVPGGRATDTLLASLWCP